MRYCKRCVQPDTRPGIYFDENDVCGACLYAEQKDEIDWDARWQEVTQIADWARGQRGPYDCVVGVSGGKDSTLQALVARDRLGLRPLLVNSEPECISAAGRHNIENLKQLGFDTIALRPNPIVMQQLMRLDFFRYLNPIKVTEYSLWASAYIVAGMMEIPLIIQGENPGLTQGVRHTMGTGSDALDIRKMNTISRNYLDEYVGDGIFPRDLFMFHYDPERLGETKGIWLQYYLREWSQSANAAFSIAHGLQVRPDTDPCTIGTYRRFYQIDNDFVQVNQMLKFIKLGFGQCTDHVNYDIRDGLITREEGIALVFAFDGLCAQHYIGDFCRYIGITVEQFDDTIERFLGPTRWWEKPEGINVWDVIERLQIQLEDEVKRVAYLG